MSEDLEELENISEQMNTRARVTVGGNKIGHSNLVKRKICLGNGKRKNKITLAGDKVKLNE